MKFSLVVALVVLALAQGSLAQAQAVPTLENLGEYFEQMKTKMTQELATIMESQDLAGQAQTLQARLEPIAAQLQEQLRTVATNVEAQVKPMAATMQDQIRPMVDNFQRQIEDIFQRLTEQARAIGN